MSAPTDSTPSLPTPPDVRLELVKLFGVLDEPRRTLALRFTWHAYNSTAFEAHPDGETARKMLDHWRVRRWLGVNHHFSLTDFLRWLWRESPLQLAYYSYDRGAGRARTLERLGLPHDLEARWNRAVEARAAGRVTPWVDLLTGLPTGDKNRVTAMYEAEIARTLAGASAKGNPDALRRVEVMNTQDRRWFTRRFTQCSAEAYAYVTRTYLEPRERLRWLKSLANMSEYPMPLYNVDAETLRIHAGGPFISWQSLPRNLRHIFLQGTVSADLKAIHGALMAALWGVDSLTAVLKREGLVGSPQ